MPSPNVKGKKAYDQGLLTNFDAGLGLGLDISTKFSRMRLRLRVGLELELGTGMDLVVCRHPT